MCHRNPSAQQVHKGQPAKTALRARPWVDSATRVLFGMVCALVMAAPARAGVEHINLAVVILRAACTLPDAQLDARKPGDGRVHLRLFVANRLRGATNLVRQDLETFTRTTMLVMSEQPPALSACMDPAVNQVIATLLEMPPDIASLPLAPPPTATPAAAPEPVIAAPEPAPAPVVVTAIIESAAAVPAAPPATPSPDAPVFSVQGCRTAVRHVVCEVKIANYTGRDQWIVIHGRQTMLFDPSGGANDLDDARMANQGGLSWKSSIGKVRVIHDTAPIMELTFRSVAESVQSVKRLEVAIGFESAEGQRLNKLVASDVPIQGR